MPRPDVVRTGNRIYELGMLSIPPGSNSEYFSEFIRILKEIKHRASCFAGPTKCDCHSGERHHYCTYSSNPSGEFKDYGTAPLTQDGQEYPCFVGEYFEIICPKRVQTSMGVMLGKGDICLFTNSSDEIWSCNMRAKFHEVVGVREIFPVPCLRLVYPEDRVPHNPEDEQGQVRVHDESMFAPIPPRGSDRGAGERRDPMPDIVCYTAVRLQPDLVESGDVELSKLPPHRGEISTACVREVFKRVIRFKHELGKRRELGTLPQEIDPHVEAYLTFSEFQVLIKFEARTFHQASDILDLLRKVGDGLILSTSTQFCLPVDDPEEVAQWETHRVDDKLFPVGLLVRVESRNMERVARILKGKLEDWLQKNRRGDGAALKIRDKVSLFHRFGFWDLHYSLDCPSLHRFAHFVLTRVAGQDGVVSTRIVPCLDREEAAEAPSLPATALPAPRTSMHFKEPRREFYEDDETWLVKRAQDLEAHISWVMSRVDQLRLEWARSSSLPHNITIWQLNQDLKKLKEDLAHKLDKPAAELLDSIRQVHKDSSLCLQRYEAIVGLYNERLEGAHLAAVLEPYSRLGERAGVLGLTLTAIDALMADYCGKSRWPYLTIDGKHFTDGVVEEDAHSNDKKEIRGWYGLVTTTTGKDFSVHFDNHFLRVPVPVKLSARSFLLSVSHEAAHFIMAHLSNLGRSSKVPDDTAKALCKTIEDLHNTVKKPLETLYAQRLYRHYVEEERYLPIVAGTLIKESINEVYRDMEVISQEVVADVLGYLIGGPPFAMGFNTYRFDGITDGLWDRYGQGDPLMIRPSLRVKLGEWIGESLFWEDGWIDLVHELGQQMYDVESRLDVSTTFSYRYTILQDVIEETLEDLVSNSALLADAQQILVDAFEPDGSPLFLSVENGKPRVSYQQIEELARRLLYDWELVLDARPRDLAAASALLQRFPVHRISTFPTLRIYLSMAYSEQPPHVNCDPHHRVGGSREVAKGL